MIVGYRPLPFSLLIAFLFFLFTSFSSSPHGASASHSLAYQTPPPSVNEAKFGEEFTYASRRSALDVDVPIGAPESSPFVLAAKRTHRPDPLDGFDRYTGGWNIKDRHYWASVAFTAIPLFIIAAIWLLGFGLSLFLISFCRSCFKKKAYGYSGTAYVLSLIFLIIFTIVAIIGCVVLYAGQKKFHGSTTKTLEYVRYQADTTVQRLQDVSNNLAMAKLSQVQRIFLPSNVQTDIDNIGVKVNSSASTLSDATVKNSHDIRDFLDSMRMALIVIAAIMLVVATLGLLFSIFGMKVLVYVLVIFGWLLVAGTFILCGVFLLLHNVTADTCVAMNEYVQNPTAHTALDDIIPCVDRATSLETLMRTKEVIYQLVEVVNEVITNVTNINFAPVFIPFYFNQSGPLVPIACNPFNPDLSDRFCTADELNLANATQVWKSYVCQISASGTCSTTGRLTPILYDQMTLAVDLCNELGDYGPFLVGLQDCTFVRETFDEIYRDHCPHLQTYSKWIYVGLAMVSTAVMLSLIFWVIYCRERHHRMYAQITEKTREEEKDAQE